MCTDYGVKNVFISGLTTSGRVEKDRIQNINSLIEEMCDIENFAYITNDNITQNHLWRDRLHLLESGKAILSQNYIDYLNHFYYTIDIFQIGHIIYNSWSDS